LLFSIFGIILISHEYESEVPVDPGGKFCYGRGILKLMVASHPGIPPRRATGALSYIDSSPSLRRVHGYDRR
jgi:hypothetical protein